MACPLHHFAREGLQKEAEAFFDEVTISRTKKAVNAVDNMQRSPLHLACWAGKVNMISLLLRNRADCMVRAQDGYTPLHFCAQSGCVEGCKLMLESGAKIDAKLHKNKRTALHLAAAKGFSEVTRVLVLAGADTTLRNSKGQTPSEVASSEDVKIALLARKPDGEVAPERASAYLQGSASIQYATGGDEEKAVGGYEGEAVCPEKVGAISNDVVVPPVHEAGDGSHDYDEGRAEQGTGEVRADGKGAKGCKGITEEVGAGGDTNEALPEGGAIEDPAGQSGDGVGVGVLGGNSRVGSLSERRRKKRKLMQAAGSTAVKGVVSLSHLTDDVDEET